MIAREVDGGNHVGDSRAAGDERGMFVDAGIPDLTGAVVAAVARLKKLTVKYQSEGLNVKNWHNALYLLAAIKS